MENKEIDNQNSKVPATAAIKQTASTIPVVKEAAEAITTHRPIVGSREEMHKVRVDFTKALGLDWSENPNPNSGYKYEHNLAKRQQYLDEARRLRNLYADMVNKTGSNKGILVKMDNNLENKDRKTVW